MKKTNFPRNIQTITAYTPKNLAPKPVKFEFNGVGWRVQMLNHSLLAKETTVLQTFQKTKKTQLYWWFESVKDSTVFQLT